MGLGAITKIYLLGTIAISELVVFFAAPILFVLDYGDLRRDGFMPMLGMVLLVIVSMLASSWYNDTPFPYIVKSFAVLYSIGAHLIVFHRLLKDNYYSLGWYLLGAVISSVITIFYFNPTAMVTEEGMSYVDDQDIESVLSGPLFWATKIVPFILLPVSATYLKIPLAYSLLAPIIATFMMMTTSVSGRSASLSVLLAGLMMLVGRKSRMRMSNIGKRFFLLCAALVTFALIGKAAYKYAALHDFLGEASRIKYENQTQSGDSILKLLMSGRKEFFAAIPAAMDKPILGHGPFALDVKGYWENFFSKYGDYDDLQRYYSLLLQNRGLPQIPTHSYIMGFWVHYGIGGLLFWLFVAVLLVQHIRKYTGVVPQWYGYLAISIANFMWALFFSPFNQRSGFAMMVCCILFARAIGQGRLQLPYEMEMEARKYD